MTKHETSVHSLTSDILRSTLQNRGRRDSRHISIGTKPTWSEETARQNADLFRVPPQKGRWLGRAKRTLYYIVLRDTNTELRLTSKATEEKKTLRATQTVTSQRRVKG